MSEEKEREVSFCQLYAYLGNVREAAVRAGYPVQTAVTSALNVLRKRKYRRLIAETREILAEDEQTSVLCSLRRLAFGDVTDAVQLLCSEEPVTVEVISGLDLINVSEVKRVKGGGIEVKFFDRQKAMEKLIEYSGEADRRSVAKNLLEALTGDDDNGV